MDSDHPSEPARLMLAPAPDFRYVGLEPAPQLGPRVAASLFLAGGGVGAGLLRELGLIEAAIGAVLVSTGLALLWRRVSARTTRLGAVVAPFAIVPWGVLIDQAEAPRTLHWAAIRALHVHTIYGRDAGTPSTLSSFVTLQTEHELFAGTTAGSVPVERLLVHLEAYAREQSHRVALDLDGEIASATGPLEPEFERILAAALETLLHAPSSQRLGLETSYRRGNVSAAGQDTIEAVRAILRDRREHALDRRPLASVIAAELRLDELVPDLALLVQSPHPMVAAIAKAAALRLGASSAKVGGIVEVGPFIAAEDLEAITAWSVSAPATRLKTNDDVPSA